MIFYVWGEIIFLIREGNYFFEFFFLNLGRIVYLVSFN